MTTIDDYISELAGSAIGEADRVNTRGLRRPISGVSFTFNPLAGAAILSGPIASVVAEQAKRDALDATIAFHVRSFGLDADLVAAHVREHGPDVTIVSLRSGEFAPVKGSS